MKNILLSGLVLFGVVGMASAREDFTYVPKPNSYNSEAVYISSYIYVGTLSSSTVKMSSFSAVVISSYPTFLHTVNVSSTGTASSFWLYNSNLSTSVATSRIVDIIDTTSKSSNLYDVFLTSGLAVNNIGTLPAGVCITYRER